jgi:hypothetical protein
MWLSLLVLAVLPRLSFEGKMTPELKSQLLGVEADEKVYVIVHMIEEYPYENIKHLTVIEKAEIYRTIARTSQEPLIEYLKQFSNKAEIIRQFWVFNGFHMEATRNLIEDIAQRDDVWFIGHNAEMKLQPMERVSEFSSRAIEWNILKVQADSCWNAGFTGDGIIIGTIDTGVYPDHEALQGKWTGYWLDAVNGESLPYDDYYIGHGTFTLGIVLGGDGFGPFANDIGVAPGAQYVCAKCWDAAGQGSPATIDPCFEFMADLKEILDIRAVYNSWGVNSPLDLHYWQACETWKSLGILPVFSSGNTGPDPGTAESPGNYSTVIGVGATTESDDIATFSSRGPAPDLDPWNDPVNWYRPDWNLIKPDISAPGVNVRSAIKNGGYGIGNGTSASAPHVCGAAAILCQKNRHLTPEDLYNLMTNNLDVPIQGAPYPNNDYGWGRLNVWKALQATPELTVPYVMLISHELNDPAPGGNGDGKFDPGETVEIITTITNIGGADGYDVSGILYSNDNFLTMINDSTFFGNVVLHDSTSNSSDPYIITAHQLTPEGHTATVKLITSGQSNNGNFCDTFGFALNIGTPTCPSAVYEDDFEYGAGIDSFLNYWAVSNYWDRTTEQSYSAPYSMYNGNVLGESYYVQLKDNFDLTPFSNPQLTFWHKHYFSPPILCYARVEVTEDGGAKWTEIWKYNWLTGDSIPWTNEIFSLFKYKSTDFNVRFSVLTFGTPNYMKWYIDDFQIIADTDNEPPFFKNTTSWSDTNYTGPFLVESEITDATGVDSVSLYYRINSGTWHELLMTYNGNDIYQSSIPDQNLGDIIDYYLWAKDKWVEPNTGTNPVNAPIDGYYSFVITNVGVEDVITESISFMLTTSNPVRDVVNIVYTIPEHMHVTIVLYDVMGRRVKTLLDQKVNAGIGIVQWDRKDDRERNIPTGIYFLRCTAGNNRKIEKIVVVK